MVELGLIAVRLQRDFECEQMLQDKREGDNLAAEITQRRIDELGGMELFAMYVLRREGELITGTKTVSGLIERGRARVAHATRIVQEYSALGQ